MHRTCSLIRKGQTAQARAWSQIPSPSTMKQRLHVSLPGLQLCISSATSLQNALGAPVIQQQVSE